MGIGRSGSPVLHRRFRDQVDTEHSVGAPKPSSDQPRCRKGCRPQTGAQRAAFPSEGNMGILSFDSRERLPASGRGTEARGDETTMTSLLPNQDVFREHLISAGLSTPAGLPGLYARGAGFEYVFDAVDAIASCDPAEDHFGRIFGLALRDGSTAHTACVGFGLERIILALFSVHGFAIRKSPAIVRRRLFR